MPMMVEVTGRLFTIQYRSAGLGIAAWACAIARARHSGQMVSELAAAGNCRPQPMQEGMMSLLTLRALFSAQTGAAVILAGRGFDRRHGF